jgi:hypothetical protein
MRFVRPIVLGGLAVALVAGLAVSKAADDKPKYTIKEVMKAAHAGDESLAKNVVTGKGSDDDKTKLVEYYTALGQNKPPKGDADSWKGKCDALLTAAKAVADGKDATTDLKKAMDCMACHSAHRPPKDK